MKCPRCGGELKRSKKDPSYGLCYNCKKKYKWVDEEDDFELDEPDPGYEYGKTKAEKKAKPKKKGGCLKIFLIVLGICVVIGVIASLAGGGDGKKQAKKEETQEQTTDTPAEEPSAPAVEPDDDVPAEYKSALNQAETYSDIMHMSKQGIYDQLVSEYGGQFSAEAAQYAVDNLEADYNDNALQTAISYQDNMNLSPEAIRDQLTSEYGDRFTQEEADYAIANLPQ